MPGREPSLRAVLSLAFGRSLVRPSLSSSGLAVLVTCEHGGHEVPVGYEELFRGAMETLASHRGWDAGALDLAKRLARSLSAESRFATVTRLLVDLNRSPHHPRVLSEFTRVLSPSARAALLAGHHAPYRDAVDADVERLGQKGRSVLHLGIHSFTPSLNGKVRRPDLALLYDPAREEERELCHAWARSLRAHLPRRVIRRNDPYRGVSDGLTTWLRRRHPGGRYLGIEVEVNQRLLDGGGRFGSEVTAGLCEGLRDAVGALGWPPLPRGPY